MAPCKNIKQCLNCPDYCDCWDEDREKCEDFEPVKTDPDDCLFMSQDCEDCYWLSYCIETKKKVIP